jgi:hypothetical protein
MYISGGGFGRRTDSMNLVRPGLAVESGFRRWMTTPIVTMQMSTAATRIMTNPTPLKELSGVVVSVTTAVGDAADGLSVDTCVGCSEGVSVGASDA